MSASREKRLRKELKASGPSVAARMKQERQDAFRRTVAITVSAVVLFALIILVVSGSGVMQANMTALSLGDVKISSAEFDYHYFRAIYETYNMYEMYGMLEYLGLDLNKSFHRQYAFGGEETWAQYFEGEAIELLKVVVAQSEAAKREGITLTQKDKDDIDKAIAEVEQMAAQNGLKPDRLLRDSYGRGITLKSYRAILERVLLSDRYAATTLGSYERSDAELQAYYEENREKYDYIDYHTFTISGVPADLNDREDGYNERELGAYREAQRKKADEMLSRVTTSEAFWELSREYEDGLNGEDDGHDHDEDDDPETLDETADGTLVEKYSIASLDGAISGFLLDGARKKGDKTVIEEGDNFIVLLYINRYREEDASINVRHLLVPFDSYATDEEAEARAQELLQMWKDGAADEDYFAELANQYSTDGGSNTNGGLYEGLSSATNFVEPFKEWYLEPTRKTGDTGIVETDYGYHIMYMSSKGDPIWKIGVEQAMNSAQYEEHRNSLVEALNYKRSWLGMLFTKSKSS